LEDFTLNAHFRRFLQSDWYNAFHLGLGLTGVTAPLSFEKRFDTIYMADSATEAYDFKIGNDPSVVDNIGWNGTGVRGVQDYPATSAVGARPCGPTASIGRYPVKRLTALSRSFLVARDLRCPYPPVDTATARVCTLAT